MRNIKSIILFCSLIALFSLVISPAIVYGTDGAGGQVNTGGKITFYEEEIVQEESTPDASEEAETDTKPEADTSAKPAGRFPSTGEMLGNFGFIGIGLLLLFLLLLLVRKWTKEEK